MKLTRTHAGLVQSGQGWAGDLPAGLAQLIGAAEVVGGIGLILPGVLDVAAWLVPAAAVGLAMLMVGAALTHLRRRDYPNVGVNLVLPALPVSWLSSGSVRRSSSHIVKNRRRARCAAPLFLRSNSHTPRPGSPASCTDLPALG
jgi:uncharacterized membrane protein YphA (DoxX/SURF4 family)